MAKDFIFRIKPGDPLPPIAPSGYRMMVDESTGAIKLLSSDGTVVNPTSDALVPTITDLQGGDFLYCNDGIGFQNIPFQGAVNSEITHTLGFSEFTYVEQTRIEKEAIIELSGSTIGIISATIDQNQYIDVDKIICEISPQIPFTVTPIGPPADLGLQFTGQASGALGNIDISFLTAEKDSYVVQHANKIDSSFNAMPNTLVYDLINNPVLSVGLSSPATINQGGEAVILITVFYKVRTFGAEYK
jgi:hypothetical protein